MSLPLDYEERVYAGVLGKLIGVYLGRPFEGWWYDRIMQELGEVNYYVHQRLGKPLIVTDDDISGTFTFARAMADYGNRRDLTARQIGQTWLNYIIENQTILWWGGVGNSTEHTAFIRLKNGIPAPQSGSIALNGATVAEQIGSQIFIDGWAMMAPNDADLASDLAVKAASVSHDGEAIYGAQVIAVMESLAFSEPSLDKLLDAAVGYIPADSEIARVIADLREWHAAEPDWHKARAKVAERYGYDKYPGNVHMVPNHAVIILALLYGDDDFQKSLMIANTAGWDTDCNSGNVGCLLGIKNGLAGIERGPDWRSPIADRLYLSTADGGRCITDAVTETYHLVNAGRALVGEPAVHPKNGARFHFELPGSVQGFGVDAAVDSAGTASLANVTGHSALGSRSLAIRYQKLSAGRSARVATPTFIPPDAQTMPGSYRLHAAPTLYAGQTVEACLEADAADAQVVTAQLYLRYYGENDVLTRLDGPEVTLEPGASRVLTWQIPDTNGDPIEEIGVEVRGAQGASGTVYLDYLTWSGMPSLTFARPPHPGKLWRLAWVNGVDNYGERWPESFRVVQNNGRGLLMTGIREWTGYTAAATIRSEAARAAGIAICVQGMRRYYALLLCAGGKARLVRGLDGETVLAEVDFPWESSREYALQAEVKNGRVRAWVDRRLIADVVDGALSGGGVAYVIEEGTLMSSAMRVEPV